MSCKPDSGKDHHVPAPRRETMRTSRGLRSTGITVGTGPRPTPDRTRPQVRSVVAGRLRSESPHSREHGSPPLRATALTRAGPRGGSASSTAGPAREVTGCRPVIRVTRRTSTALLELQRQCLRGQQNLVRELQFFVARYVQAGMARLLHDPANRLHAVPDVPRLPGAALHRTALDPGGTPHTSPGPDRPSRPSSRRRHDRRVAARGGCAHTGRNGSWSPTSWPASATSPCASAPTRRGRAAPDGPSNRSVTRSGRAPTWCSTRGIAPTLGQAIRLADKGGTVVFVGVPAQTSPSRCP